MRTCPSQRRPEPIPIVGMDVAAVTRWAITAGTMRQHDRERPGVLKRLHVRGSASGTHPRPRSRVRTGFRPTWCTACGVKPTCPMTGHARGDQRFDRGRHRRAAPSSLTAPAPVSLRIRPGVSHRLGRRHLVAQKGHVHDNQGPFRAALHDAPVVDHLVDGRGEGRHLAGKHRLKTESPTRIESTPAASTRDAKRASYAVTMTIGSPGLLADARNRGS